jgi:pimeloyl-ACP methyl ester carboxylesterase
MVDRVRLAELCAAASLFTDLGTGQPTEHGLRTCLVAMRLAAALGLPADVLSEVYYVSLLRFLGCTADAHQLAAMTGGDEVRFLAGMAPVAMGSPREEIARMIGLVAAGQQLPQRLRALARAATLLLQGSDSVPGIIEATERAAAAIPGARVQMLDGHGHFAHKTDPAMVTALIREFISARRPNG